MCLLLTRSVGACRAVQHVEEVLVERVVLLAENSTLLWVAFITAACPVAGRRSGVARTTVTAENAGEMRDERNVTERRVTCCAVPRFQSAAVHFADRGMVEHWRNARQRVRIH